MHIDIKTFRSIEEKKQNLYKKRKINHQLFFSTFSSFSLISYMMYVKFVSFLTLQKPKNEKKIKLRIIVFSTTYYFCPPSDTTKLLTFFFSHPCNLIFFFNSFPIICVDRFFFSKFEYYTMFSKYKMREIVFLSFEQKKNIFQIIFIFTLLGQKFTLSSIFSIVLPQLLKTDIFDWNIKKLTKLY